LKHCLPGLAVPLKSLKVLLSLDLEHIYETDQSMVDANQYLKDYVSAELGEPGPFSRLSGFMAPDFCRNTFPGGLLALNHSKSLAVKMLVDLAPDELVRKRLRQWFETGGVPNALFQLRTATACTGGLMAIWFGNLFSCPRKRTTRLSPLA
jgi:hypothetical protein